MAQVSVRVVGGGAERCVAALPEDQGGHQEGGERCDGPQGPSPSAIGCVVAVCDVEGHCLNPFLPSECVLQSVGSMTRHGDGPADPNRYRPLDPSGYTRRGAPPFPGPHQPAQRGRPPPLERGNPPPPLRETGLPSVDGGVQFAVWAPNATRFPSWVIGMAGIRLPTRSRRVVSRGSGRDSSKTWDGAPPTSTGSATRRSSGRRPTHSPSTPRPRPGLPPRFGTSATSGVTGSGWRTALAATPWMRRCPCTRCSLGSWRRGEGGRYPHLCRVGRAATGVSLELGFTHVELMPVMEHPFYGSWGYQTTGYFAPTSRYGTPQDFMTLIDALHRAGIGVILDWVPSHFPTDGHGLGLFDGTHLYEHADPQEGLPSRLGHLHLQLRTGRGARLPHQQCPLLARPLSRRWAQGRCGGFDALSRLLASKGPMDPEPAWRSENLEAIAFIRRLNEVVYQEYPAVQTIAEESTSWPMVSRPTEYGGLGFGFKWDMGWMHDTLSYMQKDPVHRRFHQNELTFRAIYAFHENFVLPLFARRGGSRQRIAVR